MTEVNELLFLWMVRIDERLDSLPDPRDKKAVVADREAVETALKICKKALVWVEPREPWVAMVARFKAQEARRKGAADPPAESPVSGSADVAAEPSALAAFQWGAICLREERLDRAMEWLRRAAQLQSNNYWYQYFLAYLEDKAGSVDLALRDYSIAITHRPDSHWVRFSRARLYRSKGRWETALDDMLSALKTQRGRPEAAKIELELGYLYYALGDFASARGAYDHVIELDNTGLYGPAARLNRANIDAELGSVEAAQRNMMRFFQKTTPTSPPASAAHSSSSGCARPNVPSSTVTSCSRWIRSSGIRKKC